VGVSGLFVRHKVSDRASPDVAEGACNAIILEYALVVAVVSIGWSGYLQVLLGQFGLSLPQWAMGAAGTGASHIVDLTQEQRGTQGRNSQTQRRCVRKCQRLLKLCKKMRLLRILALSQACHLASR
jgi:hypothetical protein